ncbi:N-acetyltransferase family protein [Ferrovibrio sp.]|uniref:GNAT family N-acetyltransferase n=1 Tax=Ferrovibrio sp. TaxID=1917215 RepID=UPI003D274F5F
MIELRDATAADMAAILPIYNDAVVNTTAVFDYAPRSLEAQLAWFAAKQEQHLPVLLAIEGDAVLGFASYGPFRPWPAYRHTVENAIYIAPERRGQGIGKRLLPALFARAQAAGMHAMIAGITADNAASLRLHAQLAFREAGRLTEVGWKFERWLDLVFMEKRL